MSAEPTSPASERGIITADRLRRVYNDGTAQARTAIEDISFTVREGELVCIVGPSGAGKTTLLRALSGLAQPTSGTVTFEGRSLTSVPSRFGLVFQDYGRSLYPWFTNGRNVALPLLARRVPRAERKRRVSEVLASVGLGHVQKQYPWELSGGMQQRVAIARALSYRPDVLLMDEPFASVDAQTRYGLEDLVLAVRRDLGITVVIVTHDIDEAVYLSDRVVVLTDSPARVKEIVEVPLGDLRDQIATRSSPEFMRLRGHILDLVMPRAIP
ncbi:ABC transporter ATP-binding protein [Microbacterium sp.]|uniref:ABC transporter ATP-binding protein n=1 Tax=Microbacterium sp. TaxID=51671 RepID=UPI003F98F668